MGIERNLIGERGRYALTMRQDVPILPVRQN
jgi:hypothetical protein